MLAAKSQPIHKNVKGTPFKIGEFVRVLSLVDSTISPFWLERRGVVAYFEYNCGCGQSYPQDPMIGVRFEDGRVQEFWHEELELPQEEFLRKKVRASRGTHDSEGSQYCAQLARTHRHGSRAQR